MSILDVRHQANAQVMLQRALACQRLPHAFIFHGPDGVGKEMLARRFAQLLLCHKPIQRQDPPAEYTGQLSEWQDCCGSCKACKLIQVDTHPDCHMVHRYLIKFHPDADVRKRKGLVLTVDVIRHFLIEAATKKAAMGPCKVFIIREAERLNDSAQNALLKTIEEPPEDTYIILITRSQDVLRPTTRSRCQQVPFTLLPSAFIAERLASLRPELTEDHIHYFANHEGGGIGPALNLIDDGFYECKESLTQTLLELQRTDILELPSQIEGLADTMGKAVKERLKPPAKVSRGKKSNQPAPALEVGFDVDADPDVTDADAKRQALSGILSMMATTYRDILRLACDDQAPICNRAHGEALRRLSSAIGPTGARRAIRALAATETKLNLNVNSKLCLDELAIRLTRLHAH